MSRTGPRPNAWKVKGEIPHQQYLAWLQTKAQANFRGEVFALTFEQFQQLWADNWHLKGRGKESYCLTREDPDGAWIIGNVMCIPRVEHLRRQKVYKGQRNGKQLAES
jgi:hypothetical protein